MTACTRRVPKVYSSSSGRLLGTVLRASAALAVRSCICKATVDFLESHQKSQCSVATWPVGISQLIEGDLYFTVKSRLILILTRPAISVQRMLGFGELLRSRSSQNRRSSMRLTRSRWDGGARAGSEDLEGLPARVWRQQPLRDTPIGLFLTLHGLVIGCRRAGDGRCTRH